MNKDLNYYKILEVSKESSKKEIKKSYYKLSFKNHPDQNKGVSTDKFNLISEAYRILSNVDTKEEYDRKSKFGLNYNEDIEFLNVDLDYDYDKSKQKLKDFKKNQINNIQIEIGDDFDGSVEYGRWVICKKCDGSGKDLDSKIIIKNEKGEVTSIFDSDDGCDFCEGTGKGFGDEDCGFCNGKGKIGINDCKVCKGEKRIFGKQKLNNIKMKSDTKKIDAMGHYSKQGKIGYLLLVRK